MRPPRATNAKMRAEWRDDALCHKIAETEEHVVSAFDDPGAEGTVKEICAQCKVQTECLTAAKKEHDSQGWRGGVFFDEGSVIKGVRLRRMKAAQK